MYYKAGPGGYTVLGTLGSTRKAQTAAGLALAAAFSQPARAPGSSPRGVGNPRPASLPHAPPGKQRLAVPTEGRAGRGPGRAIGGAGSSAAADAVRASSGRVQAGVEGSARPPAGRVPIGGGRAHSPGQQQAAGGLLAPPPPPSSPFSAPRLRPSPGGRAGEKGRAPASSESPPPPASEPPPPFHSVAQHGWSAAEVSRPPPAAPAS
ncbi:basic proline-rich protein-like [Cervus canadensis]|uniref:basic proline-rich protein-like n=1 Tax=Cervus canadensis TaxID=1574408 RepID=UPI001CA34978|nr:basic proline-rich protein-like [Cervus canadensis]